MVREWELEDTIPMMQSNDYKERFKAEYHQTFTRWRKLKGMMNAYKNRTLPFLPTCPMDIYKKQEAAMRDYLDVLEARAEMEDVELWKEED